MKRKITAFMTALILSISLSACGNNISDLTEKPLKETDAVAVAKPVEEPKPAKEPVIEKEIIDLDKEVVFSDEYLAETAKSHCSSLTVGGLQEITYIDLYYDEITVPEELAYFTNLKALRMKSEKSGDLSWLSNVPNLEYLCLKYNHIDNIEEIGNCAKLITLDIYSYNVTDISFLEKLQSIEELSIESDVLQDFSSVGNLANLRILRLYSNIAEKLNIDFSNLTNLQEMYLSSDRFTDLTALDTLNVYNEPTFSNRLYDDENYNGLDTLHDYSTEDYRDNYSNDKRPEGECFRKIEIMAGLLTDESIQTIANINYKYLQALDFHIDKNYELINFSCYAEEGFIDDTPEKYSEAWDNLVLANGDPLLQNEAVTVTPLPDLENFDNPKVYLDGRYVGLYCSLEDMVNGFTIDGDDALDYINSVYVRAGSEESIGLYSKYDLTITVTNMDENLAKPISECEVTRIKISRNTDLELRLPQGNETNEYVSWDYPCRNFTDIYENCYTDTLSYYILGNDPCDVIQIYVEDNEFRYIQLYKLENQDKVEQLKRRCYRVNPVKNKNPYRKE